MIPVLKYTLSSVSIGLFVEFTGQRTKPPFQKGLERMWVLNLIVLLHSSISNAFKIVTSA